MTNIFLKTWNWCRRFRNRCGYGVHSPSDFFLITFVIYERMPYYAYETLSALRKCTKQLPHYREKVDKLLLRLVNYLQPSLLLEIGTGSGLNTCYLAEGNHSMEVVTFTDNISDEVKSLFLDSSQIDYRQGSVDDAFRIWNDKKTSKVIVHIAHTPYYKEVFEKLLPLVNEHTCFIIGSPYADKAKKAWWKDVIADTRTGVTFDLYDIGLVFFDYRRVKEHRIVNFL